MKIGLLKADSVNAEFEPRFGDYPDMFQRLLKNAADQDIEFVVYDVQQGEYPSAIADCDGYLITGSRRSVYENEPWIHDLEAFVVKLAEAQAKLVGICFGHQMVAQALGGKTEPASVGWGVGVHRSQIISQKAYMEPAQEEVIALVSHKDQVTQLPVGAELLATSEFCPNSMYQIGDHILAYQGHPEFEKGYSEALMNMRQEILGETVYNEGVKSLDTNINSEVIARWMVRFLAGS